jgi:thiamine-monophosphate kinase
MAGNRSGESARLDMIRAIVGADQATVRVGVDALDDAAIVDIGGDQQLVIASDFIRGSEFHLFQLGLLNYFDVGYYLIAANLSDMAAMGVRPAGLLTVIRYAKAMDDEAFVAVFQGMQSAAEKYETPIVGGDIGGYIADVFSATAFGTAPTGRYLSRSGARPGDVVCLTGPIGGGIGALTYCKEIKPTGATLSLAEEEELLRHWRRPVPRIAEGLLLESRSFATACMDVSDGLKASLDQLARFSRVGFEIEEKSVPIDPLVRKFTKAGGLDALSLATSASVDFQLLCTVRPELVNEAVDTFSLAGLNLTPIGRALEGGDVMLKRDDGTVPFPGIAWDHQLGNHVADIVKMSRGKSQ